MAAGHPSDEGAVDADGNRLRLVQVQSASDKKPVVSGGQSSIKEAHTVRMEGMLSIKDPRNVKDPVVVAVCAAMEVEAAEDDQKQSLLAPVPAPKGARDAWLSRSGEQEVAVKSRELKLTAPADRIGKLAVTVRAILSRKEETFEIPAAAGPGWNKVAEGLLVRVKEATVDRRNKGTLRLEYKRDNEGAAGGAFVRSVEWLGATGQSCGGGAWTAGEGPLGREGVFLSESTIAVKPGEAAGAAKLRLMVVTEAEEVPLKFELGALFAK